LRRKATPVTSEDAVTLAYVHPDEVAHSWHASLIELIGWDFGHEGRIMRGGRLAVKYGSGGLVAARNEAAARFLEECTDSEWLFWIDTDMGFAPDTIDRLVEVADPVTRPIVGGLCFAQKETAPDGLGGFHCEPRVTVFDFIQTEQHVGFVSRTRYPINTVVQCAGTGAACILIHRSVFQRIADEFGPIWYERIPNPKTGKLFGEDLSFCLRAQAVNIPLFVHTGVKTSHLKRLWLQEQDYWSFAVAPPATERTAVLVPGGVFDRAAELVSSVRATTSLATVYAVVGPDEDEAERAWKEAGADLIIGDGFASDAQRINAGFAATSEPWVFVAREHASFHPGWLDHVQGIAEDRYAVVGTNDLVTDRSTAGHYSDNLLIRRSYVLERGASWGEPGVVCHKGYSSLGFVFEEIVTAAKQRDVWAMALGARVEGVRGAELERSDADEALFAERMAAVSPQVDAFQAAADVLDAAGVTWWISDGAVLGHVREGGFLSTDPDVDLGFWAEDLESVGRAFIEARWWRLPANDFKLMRDRVSVDLHAHERDGERVFFLLGGDKYRYVFPAHVFDKFTIAEFHGRQVRIPCPAEDYLVAHYGPDWKTPKKSWRWDADPPCLERTSERDRPAG
jgi:hypothetical protein